MAVSPGCAIVTHEFRGAASRVLVEATAFGLRRDHVLVEILATFPDRSDHSRNKGIAGGREPRLPPWLRWRFLVDIRTSSPGATRTARR